MSSPSVGFIRRKNEVLLALEDETITICKKHLTIKEALRLYQGYLTLQYHLKFTLAKLYLVERNWKDFDNIINFKSLKFSRNWEFYQMVAAATHARNNFEKEKRNLVEYFNVYSDSGQ